MHVDSNTGDWLHLQHTSLHNLSAVMHHIYAVWLAAGLRWHGGCKVIPVLCWEKTEASRSCWGQICHVALESSSTFNLAQAYNTEVRYLKKQYCCQLQCSRPSPTLQALCNRSLRSQSHTDFGMQPAASDSYPSMLYIINTASSL